MVCTTPKILVGVGALCLSFPLPVHEGTLQNGAILECSNMKGTGHLWTHCLASQRLKKLFGSVEVAREVLAGAFRATHVPLHNFGFLNF
jgi:hypothetical protein